MFRRPYRVSGGSMSDILAFVLGFIAALILVKLGVIL